MISSMVLQSFFLGIVEGINPLALATALVFIVFLSYMKSKGRPILTTGSGFLMAAFGVNIMISIGSFDMYLADRLIVKVIRGLDIVMGVFLIVAGIIHFMDWVRYKKYRDENKFILKFPSVSQASQGVTRGPGKIRILTSLQYLSISVLAGLVLILLNSIWPKDYRVLLNFYSLYLNGLNKTAFLSLAVNSLGYIILTILAWVFFVCFQYFKPVRDFVVKSISILKILSSAFCLSAGYSLIYVLVKIK